MGKFWFFDISQIFLFSWARKQMDWLDLRRAQKDPAPCSYDIFLFRLEDSLVEAEHVAKADDVDAERHRSRHWRSVQFLSLVCQSRSFRQYSETDANRPREYHPRHRLRNMGLQGAFSAPGWVLAGDSWLVDCHAYWYFNRSGLQNRKNHKYDKINFFIYFSGISTIDKL